MTLPGYRILGSSCTLASCSARVGKNSQTPNFYLLHLASLSLHLTSGLLTPQLTCPEQPSYTLDFSIALQVPTDKYSLPKIYSRILCGGPWTGGRQQAWTQDFGSSPDSTDWEHILGTEESDPSCLTGTKAGWRGSYQSCCWEPEQSQLNTA